MNDHPNSSPSATVGVVRQVLVPVDFRAPCSVATRAAVAVAQKLEAALTLLHVLEPVTDDPDIVAHWGDFPQERRAFAMRQLRRWAQDHGAGDAACLLAEGRPFEQIIDHASGTDCGLVVLGRNGGANLMGRVLGGTAERVARGAACPVLIVGPDQSAFPREPRRVMLTTDYSDDSLSAFPWADRIARIYGADILLVNVQEPMGLPGTQEYARYGEQIDALRQEADDRLDAWREDHLASDLQVEARVAEGTPHSTVCRLADHGGADLIVIATHGSTGWWRDWLGGTAEGVLRHAPCSVLVIPSPRTGPPAEEGLVPERPRKARTRTPLAAIDLDAPVSSIFRTDFPALPHAATIGEALDLIREGGAGERLVYFYVTGPDQRLLGVIPTRRLLTAPLNQKVSAHMIEKVTTLRPESTLLEASEVFTRHKFLALPVVDGDNRLVGVVDVSALSDKLFDLAEREQMDEIFEAIGFRVSQVREASPFRAFRFRFPWLLATITSGTVCAVLASAFELTLAKSIVLAFFLTLILGLGESVSIQSMTVAIQALHSTRPTWQWYLIALRREASTAVLLGTGCGALVALIVWSWRGEGLAAASIGSSIALALLTACVIGLSIPALLHALRLDPKIAAGPITLALTDIFTLLFYFGLAWWLL